MGKTDKRYIKIITLIVMLTLILIDIMPIMGFAVETTQVGEQDIQETLITEQDELEDETEIDDPYIEDGLKLEGTVEQGLDDKEELNLDETDEQDLEPTTYAENKYVLAKDSDFEGTSNGSFKYIGKDDYVEIPHVIKGVNVTSYQYMFQNRGQGVKGVKSTNKNVVNMKGMFKDFKGNSTLDLSELDVSNVTNMDIMFEDYDMHQNTLRTLVGLDTWNTSNVTQMYRMFYRSGIQELDLTSFDTSNVQDMSSMFKESRTTKIDISTFHTPKLTTMGSMFELSKVTSLDMSKFDTSKVTNMWGLFKESSVTVVKGLDNWDTSKVTNMGRMFEKSKMLEIDISSFSTQSATSTGYMFADTKVSSIDVSHFDTSINRQMQGMFKGTEATSIKGLGNFNTSNVTNMGYMFDGSYATNLDLSSFNTGKVTEMVHMFRNSKATDIQLGDNFTTSNVKKMTQMFKNSQATSLNLTGFDTRNVVDMDEIFKGSQATELDLSSFNTSRITDMSSMFEGSRATKIDVSSFDTTYVTDMGSMFKDTVAKEINLSSFNLNSVNNTDNMFQNAKATKGLARTKSESDKLNFSTGKLSQLTFLPTYKQAMDKDFKGLLNGDFRYNGTDEYIEIPHTIKGINVTNYNSMFEGTSVKGVVSTNKKVTDMRNMFKDTTSSTIDVTGIDTSNVLYMDGMFSGAKATTLNLMNFDTTKVTSMNNMFKGTRLTTLDLGSFDLTNVKDTTNMFQNATTTIGYGRTSSDVSKLNNSSNKPTTLKFTVWGIITEQNTDDWTNEPVEVQIKAVSGINGIDYVELVNEEGRNYLLNSEKGAFFSANNSATNPSSGGTEDGVNWIRGHLTSTGAFHLNTYFNRGTYLDGRGTHYSEDLYPLPSRLTYSLSVMSKEPINVRLVNRGDYIKLEPNKWTRIQNTDSNAHSGGEKARPWGLYATGTANTPKDTKVYYKEYKIEKGDKATPWKPAPEDSESSSDQSDVFKVYNNGTYIFRATDTKGNTKVVTHKVSNIDTTAPTATLSQSTTGWTSQDVEITVNAEDDLSGISHITLPDGTKVNGDKATYKATENKSYTFKITDKAGNTTEESITIDNIDRSIPKLTATLDNTKWTREPVNITVKSEESKSGLVDIQMKDSPLEGRNLLKGTSDENKTVSWEGWDYHLTSSRAPLKDYGLKFGDEITGSFYVEDTNVPTTTFLQFLNLTAGSYIQSSGNQYAKGESGETVVTTKVPELTLKGDNVDVFKFAIRNQLATKAKTTYHSPKLEFGGKNTPWTPAPEDIKLINNSKTFPVIANGNYTFEATYNNGMSSETSVNVTNIDLDAPKLTIKNNPTDWVEEDEIELHIQATDDKSGVKSIRLPDGKEVKGDTATYTVNKNGDYTFKAIDNVGNETTHTETVDRLMIEYKFTVTDNKNNPVSGAGFELLKDGEVFKTAESNKDGLVDFGKVPPTWKYTLRQVYAPEGGTVQPGEIEIEDPTEPVEVIIYPRGDELPSTGTLIKYLTLILSLVIVIVLVIINHKKRNITK